MINMKRFVFYNFFESFFQENKQHLYKLKRSKNSNKRKIKCAGIYVEKQYTNMKSNIQKELISKW